MNTRELILYATPTGPLAAVCDTYFVRAAAIDPTAAQGFPPHCTLTGFFHRRDDRVRAVAGEVERLLSSTGQPGSGDVEVVGPVRRGGWLGLELRSAVLARITADFVDHHRLEPGDDRLRPKDQLHLSLAYGVADLDPYRDAAADLDFGAGGTEPWEVALWERRQDGSWFRFGVD